MTSLVSRTSVVDYSCSLQNDKSLPGRIHISKSHVCFHANISGRNTDVSIPMNEITSLEKQTTANGVPNEIRIATQQAEYTFTSFLSRNATYDVIYNTWKPPSLTDNAILPQHATQAIPAGGVPAQPSSATEYKEPEPFNEIALVAIFPGTPERVYNLMFASGFLKGFMAGSQNLLDIQMSDWEPISPGSSVVTRDTSYIKPLNQVLGPRQTKCEIREEIDLANFDKCVSVLTTTRTPDVPSGGMFSVKTRTSIVPESATTSRVLVTTTLDWTGRSFLSSVIERFAIGGQKVYYADLEYAMHQYISQHPSEFLIIEGITSDAEPLTESHLIPIDGAAKVGSIDGEHGLHGSTACQRTYEDDEEFEHDFEVIRLQLDELEEWDHIDDIECFILQGWRR